MLKLYKDLIYLYVIYKYFVLFKIYFHFQSLGKPWVGTTDIYGYYTIFIMNWTFRVTEKKTTNETNLINICGIYPENRNTFV